MVNETVTVQYVTTMPGRRYETDTYWTAKIYKDWLRSPAMYADETIPVKIERITTTVRTEIVEE